MLERAATAFPADPRLSLLRREVRRLTGVVEADLTMRQELEDLNDEQWMVSAIAETIGGAGDLPSLITWFPAEKWIATVEACVAQADVMAAAHALQQAADAASEAHQALQRYREATISGAELSTKALEITAAAGAVAASVATGGSAAAAGAGLLGSATAVGLGTGAYGVIQEEAGQAGEMIAATRAAGDFDVKALLIRGGGDAAAGFVGTLAGGALSKYAIGHLGRAATAAMQPAQLAAVAEALGVEAGTLTPEIFVSAGRRFIVDFLAGAAITPLTTAVQLTVGQLGGGKPPSGEEFARKVMENAVEGGIVQLFLGGLTHGWTSAGLETGFDAKSSRGSGGSRAGETPPPGEPTLAAETPSVPKPTSAVESAPTTDGAPEGETSPRLGPPPEGAIEVKLTDAEYRRALEAGFAERGMDPTFKVIHEVSRRAAANVVKDPEFVAACKAGKWMKAGRLFHRAPELAGKQYAATAPEAQGFTFEDTLKGGKGGGRADALSSPQGGQVREYDWKTSGKSAVKSIEQMDRHKKLLAVERQLAASGQESVTWIDYVRGLLTNRGIQWP
jgi:hypothetical protein